MDQSRHLPFHAFFEIRYTKTLSPFKDNIRGIYRRMVSCIKAYAPHAMIYFCMEDDEVWQKSLGFIPSERGGLPVMLDNRAALHCGLE